MLIKSHLFDGCFTLSTSIIDTVRVLSGKIGKKKKWCSFDVRMTFFINFENSTFTILSNNRVWRRKRCENIYILIIVLFKVSIFFKCVIDFFLVSAENERNNSLWKFRNVCLTICNGIFSSFIDWTEIFFLFRRFQILLIACMRDYFRLDCKSIFTRHFYRVLFACRILKITWMTVNRMRNMKREQVFNIIWFASIFLSITN